MDLAGSFRYNICNTNIEFWMIFCSRCYPHKRNSSVWNKSSLTFWTWKAISPQSPAACYHSIIPQKLYKSCKSIHGPYNTLLFQNPVGLSLQDYLWPMLRELQILYPCNNSIIRTNTTSKSYSIDLSSLSMNFWTR